MNDIEHTVTKTNPPEADQTNGICERFHQTVLNEFFRVEKMYEGLEEIQRDLDEYTEHYNNRRTNRVQGVRGGCLCRPSRILLDL